MSCLTGLVLLLLRMANGALLTAPVWSGPGDAFILAGASASVPTILVNGRVGGCDTSPVQRDIVDCRSSARRVHFEEPNDARQD